MAGPSPLLASPSARHWMLFAALVLFGGSSFGAIRTAVESAPPAVVSAGRLWVAVIVLSTYMWGTGRKLPPLREAGRLSSVWIFALVIGAIGYAIPMTLFPFAQQTVSSMLAGIYMACMPIATVVLAALFADEPLTRRKVIGFCAGTFGVVILIGPAALGGIFTENVIAQLALIAANICYAVASVVTRRAPPAPARSFAAAFMLCGAICATPAAIVSGVEVQTIGVRSWLAIIYLGVVPTGLGAIFMVHIIRGAGASFIAMANYLTPLVAILFGAVLFQETLQPRYVFGLTAILTGVAIAQPGPAAAMRGVVAGGVRKMKAFSARTHR